MNTLRPRPSTQPYVVALLALAWSASAQVVVVPSTTSSREGAKAAIEKYELFPDKFTRGHLLKLHVTDGQIGGEMLADVPSAAQPQRVEVDGDDGLWVIRKRTTAGGGAASQSYATATRYDFDAAPDDVWQASITLRSNYVSIYGSIGENAEGIRPRLLQQNGLLTFTVTQAGPRASTVIFTAKASSLRQLQVEHPTEVRQYLAPVFRCLAHGNLLRPGPADVYRAFPQIEADPAAVRRLDELLGQLEDGNYAARNRAAKELAAMGRPGVLAALRRERLDLSTEAVTRLDHFIALHTARPPEPIEKSLADRSFLLDCMDDDDPSVRVAAKAALEKQVGRGVDVDLNADAPTRAAAIDAARKKFAPTTRPATRPAVKAPAVKPAP